MAHKDPHATALGRKRWTQTGDDPHAVGALGGRPRKTTRCPRCGKMCESARAAWNHCLRSRE